MMRTSPSSPIAIEETRRRTPPQSGAETGRDERPLRQRSPSRVERSGRPAERAQDDDERSQAGRPSPRRTGRRGRRARRIRARTRRTRTCAGGGRTRFGREAPSRSGCCRRAAPRRRPEPFAAPRRASRGRAGRASRRRRSRRRTCLRPIGSPLRSPRGSANGEQCGPRDEVPRRHGQIGREIANHDRERDERRAPDDVDRDQGKPDPRVSTRRHATRMTAARTISSSRLRPFGRSDGLIRRGFSIHIRTAPCSRRAC